MKRLLDSTIIKFKDLKDQPSCDKVLILRGRESVPSMAISCDRVDIGEVYISVSRYVLGLSKEIAMFPIDFEWGVFDASTFQLVPREELLRRNQTDMTDMRTLQEEIDPEGAKERALIEKLEKKRMTQLAEGNGPNNDPEFSERAVNPGGFI